MPDSEAITTDEVSGRVFRPHRYHPCSWFWIRLLCRKQEQADYTESEIIQDFLQMDEEEFYTVVQICDALKKTDVDISE